jgi:hypothetical protein
VGAILKQVWPEPQHTLRLGEWTLERGPLAVFGFISGFPNQILVRCGRPALPHSLLNITAALITRVG